MEIQAWTIQDIEVRINQLRQAQPGDGISLAPAAATLANVSVPRTSPTATSSTEATMAAGFPNQPRCAWSATASIR